MTNKELSIVESGENKLSKAHTELKIRIDEVYDAATETHRIAATDLSASGKGMRKATINAITASIIARDANKRNRSLTVSKVLDLYGAIERDEWKYNHQGLAFYPDGTLADGQHRINAIALATKPVEIAVFSDFDKNAIDTIDRSTKRTAGEALEMAGIQKGKEKAAIGKAAMDYEFKLAHGKGPRFTDPQVEHWVMTHEPALNEAIHIGIRSTENVTDACLSTKDAKTIALLMILGGWGNNLTVGFLASIQQGVATYPESPTVVLSKLFLRAKINARKTDNLSTLAKLALALKGAALWHEEKSVARLSWKSNKETLPTNVMVVEKKENSDEENFVN